jgi:transposase InsO family protein
MNLKILSIDHGHAYLSNKFQALCEEKEIRRQLMIPGTPQQNGVVERQNRTLLEMFRSMIWCRLTSLSFWRMLF